MKFLHNKKTGKFETRVRTQDIKKWLDEGYNEEQMLSKIVLLGGRNLAYYRHKIKDVIDNEK